jgi:quercetin dioxygenase-like cupin family protein
VTSKPLVNITDLSTLNPDIKSDYPYGWYRGANGYTMQLNHGEPMGFTAVIEFLPDKPRGNHYHRERYEQLTVITGKLAACFWLPEQPQTGEKFVLIPGMHVSIPPGVVHVYEALEPSLAVEQAAQSFKLSDTVMV